MKKNYTEPSISVRRFSYESIVTVSGNDALQKAAEAVTSGSLSINNDNSITVDELVQLRF